MPKKKCKTTKKKTKKSPCKKCKVEKVKKAKGASPKPIGVVTHFYDRISVGIVKVKSPIKVGDTLHFMGKKGESKQAIHSMQLSHKPIEKAPKGKEVGIKLNKPVHEKDLIYLVK